MTKTIGPVIRDAARETSYYIYTDENIITIIFEYPFSEDGRHQPSAAAVLIRDYNTSCRLYDSIVADNFVCAVFEQKRDRALESTYLNPS